MLKIINDELCDGIDLCVGVDFSLPMAIKTLSHLGYSRVERIENDGEFCVRGDVLDICFSLPNGWRILYFGDAPEAIKSINIDNFSTGKAVQNLHIPPRNDGVNFWVRRAKILIFSTEIDTEIVLNLHAKTRVFRAKNTLFTPNLHVKSIAFDSNLTTHFRADTPLGALVWHEKYGLGRYVGAKKMNLGGGAQSYIVLQYHRRALVYVPITHAHLLYNYHGTNRRLDSI